jgi:hypothetical protein
MKTKCLYIFVLFLCGMFAFSSTEARSSKSLVVVGSPIIIKACSTNPEKPFTGDSPFIRFHSATNVGGVFISTPRVSLILLKPVNDIPEKFAGILAYLSTVSFRLPVTREIYYSTPLRSPPFFC